MKDMNVDTSKMKFIFFGTPNIAVTTLNILKNAKLVPTLIITQPDKPIGRKKILTPPPVKIWAEENNIDVLQPPKIDNDFTIKLANTEWDIFVVVAYGKILPETLLDIPKKGTLNMHPSLLPRLRGPSPIRSAILTDEKKTGVSVMLLDEKMDHGPILTQKEVAISNWPPDAFTLEDILAKTGGKLLAETIPLFVNDEIKPTEQDHSKATFCKIIKKEDGLLDLSDGAYQNLLKIHALEGWPGTYTFFERNNKRIRVQILSAHIENDKLIIDSVKPEGKSEMQYKDFARSGATPIKNI